jgi:hypothetical protein
MSIKESSKENRKENEARSEEDKHETEVVRFIFYLTENETLSYMLTTM